jgi:beta-glucanase (GH16 family)
MKNLFTLILMALLSLSMNGQTWNLVWSDEFTSSIGSDWVFETGTGTGGWGNNELEYYRTQNASVVGGALQIQARRESYGGMAYTSARMKTQGKKSWTYGKIEGRIAMPSFTGVWPAFWMLGDNIGSVGWPACGEIDIMEHVNTGNTVYGTIHWDYNGYASYGGNTTPSAITGYHVYSIEWNSSAIKWFVDGAQFHEANIAGSINGTDEFHRNFFILLNLAIGGNWPGFTVDNNAFPANMNVDYIRVYQQGTTPPPTGVVTVYKDCSYGGYAIGLNAGSYTTSQLQALGILDNDISSIRVTAGYQATLYQNNNFGGTSLVRTTDDDCLVNEGFNDVISSVVIAPVSGSWTTTIQAESYSAMAGVQTETTTDAGGGLNVGWIEANDWMAYPAVTIPSAGTYTIEYRVASLSGGGTLQFELAGGSPVYGSLAVPSTGGWQTWTTIKHTVNLSAGSQSFAIKALAGGWNINWFKISQGVKSAGDEEIVTDEPLTSETKVFPNPVVNTLHISSADFIKEVFISDMLGKTIYRTTDISNIDTQIDVSNLNQGVYFLSIVKDGSIETKQFLKQ